jgi:hypothetical protein
MYDPLPVNVQLWATPDPPLSKRYSVTSCTVSSAPLVAAVPPIVPTAVTLSLHGTQTMALLTVGVTLTVGVPDPVAELFPAATVVPSTPENSSIRALKNAPVLEDGWFHVIVMVAADVLGA